MNEDNDLQDLLDGPVGEMAHKFFAVRQYAVDAASYPRDECIPPSSGKVPFVIDDGETAYAVIFPDGELKPLPLGYELDAEDLVDDEDVVIMATIAFSTVPSGLLRYIPVRKDFQAPDDEAFEMERLLEQALAEGAGDSAFEFEGLVFHDDVFLDAKSGEPFTGVAKLHWENGALRKEAHFSDGALDGKMTWWYENGQKELEDDYVDNQRHGKHRAWHENGALWAEGSSVNGDRHGTWRWWHDNGQLAEETDYTDGFAHGKHEKWHANGTQALLTMFEEGHEHGIHKEWYESGQLQAIIPMADGEMHGTVQLWDKDGQQKEDIEFIEGEQVTSVCEEVAGEEVEDLKQRIMELVESEEAKAALEDLIFSVEEAADGNLDQVAEALQEVIEHLEQKLKTDHSDIDAKIPLIEATVDGNVKEIRRLLKEGPEPDVGAPGFVYAILANQPKAFEVYVKHGIDVGQEFDWKNGDGSILPNVNALILAAGIGNTWAVKRLLDLGADPNLETSGGQTPLRTAITNGQDEVVDLLFDTVLDFSDSSAGRVLVAGAKAENAALVARCLEAGIPVNATDASGWTALKCAVNDLDKEMAELLLQHGADCDIADNEGWTPLLNAIENRDLEFVNLLLSHGADPNATPEFDDESDQSGFSALMRAAHYGEAKILEALIAAGADLAQTDSDGYTAVHYAALHRQPSCLKILLKQGADPNSKSADGDSPIGMFLVGLVTVVEEGVVIDQDQAVKTLNLLIKNGANWQEAAGKTVATTGEVDITLLNAARSVIKEKNLSELSKAIDRLNSRFQLFPN
jgi:ankyrin repeat protein/antitoxin component YwqK of YwqJK toxin-antitoxin module